MSEEAPGESLRVLSSDASALDLAVAGLGSRSFAFIVDWHIRALLALAWVASMLGVEYVLERVDGGAVVDLGSSQFGYLTMIPAGALYLLYHPVLEAIMHGRTPGKRMTGVRIVALDGSTPGLGAILIRNAFRVIDSIPAFYALGLVVGFFTRNQVRIGDLAAGTLLVHDHALEGERFEGVSRRLEVGADLDSAELAEDLLGRWSSLRPQMRRQLALRLLASHDRVPPAGLRTRALERWIKDHLAAVRDGDGHPVG